MTIDIFRHAESTANAGAITNDIANIPLTIRGHSQARQLSEVFDDLSGPELIIVSPFLRTQQTAAPTIARFYNAEREVWPIHEFNYLAEGKHIGKNWEMRAPFSREYWQRNDPDYVDGEGAESFNQLIGRVDNFIKRASQLKQKNVAIFSHSQFMLALFMRLSRPELDGADLMRKTYEARELVRLPNTARMQLTLLENGKLVSGFSPVAA